MRLLRWPYAALDRMIPAEAPLFVGLDYDGTLVPIAEHPSQAVLPGKTKRLIKRLSRKKHVQVFIASGRALSDVKRMVGLRQVPYAGNHGLEIEDGRLRRVHPVARTAATLLQRLARRLRPAIRPIPGAWIENKRWTLSLHCRQVPAHFKQRWSRSVKQAISPYRRLVRVAYGKCVIEIHPPVKWGKAEALAWLLRRKTAKEKTRPFVIYFGDDETDESAFRAVNRMRGLSIFVGPMNGPSASRYRVESPADVQRVLNYLLKRCRNLLP